MEEKKIRLGVFGCYRGSAIAACAKIAGAEIVAACDSNPKMIERIKPHLAEDGVIYDNFDEFINVFSTFIVCAYQSVYRQYVWLVVVCLCCQFSTFCTTFVVVDN